MDSNELFLGICCSKNQDSQSITQNVFGIIVKLKDKSYAVSNAKIQDDTGTHICVLWSALTNIYL